jgi:hypothetical protein
MCRVLADHIGADPAERPSMDEVRGALHDMYSAEVRRLAELCVPCGLLCMVEWCALELLP